jgi:AraC-like DNA-binding protein
MGASLVILFQHKKNIRDQFSALEKINLDWLRFFLILFLTFWLLAIGFGKFMHLENWDSIWTASTLIIFLIGNYGFMQPQIFFPASGTDKANGMEADPAGKLPRERYKKSGLSDEQIQFYCERLKGIMREQKPFMNPSISLTLLAEKCGIASHHLSRIINEKMECTFYEYINALRVEEARILLKSEEFRNYSIADICFESGFSTLSTFNVTFKKRVGVTPSQYRNAP